MIKRILIRKFPYLFFKFKEIKRFFQLQYYKNKDTKYFMSKNKKMYEKHIKRILDWNNLQTYTEKMQYDKMFNLNPLKTQLADKYRVRSWVENKIGSEYLINLLGVWDNIKDINFDKLPNKFVLKTNCGSGDVIIVKDKSKLTNKDILVIKQKLKFHMMEKFSYNTCEFHYLAIEPKIIAEEFIDSGETDLRDYKFLCFNGKPYYCWVDVGRYHDHTRNVYDLNWNLQDWNQKNYPNYLGELNRPKNFDQMLDIVEKLCEGFPHVRVDLYNNNGKIYFGEMTFTNGSGFEPITPIEKDYELGNLWNLDCEIPKVMR